MLPNHSTNFATYKRWNTVVWRGIHVANENHDEQFGKELEKRGVAVIITNKSEHPLIPLFLGR